MQTKDIRDLWLSDRWLLQARSPKAAQEKTGTLSKKQSRVSRPLRE